jgi:flagellar secretion chaperone FliS
MSFDPKQAYRETAAQGAGPVHLVVLLYEQIVQDLRRAIRFTETNDTEARTFELSHAMTVVGQLQALLDMERGGEVARNLGRFYGLVRARLLEAQVKEDVGIMQEQIELLLSVRDAWAEVESLSSGPQETKASSPEPGPRPALNWSA